MFDMQFASNLGLQLRIVPEVALVFVPIFALHHIIQMNLALFSRHYLKSLRALHVPFAFDKPSQPRLHHATAQYYRYDDKRSKYKCICL